MPDPSCDDLEEWERAIQELKDGILSDAGRQGPWRRAGRPPETSAWTEQGMRAPRDLLGAGVEELNAEQIEAKVAELRAVCRLAIEMG